MSTDVQQVSEKMLQGKAEDVVGELVVFAKQDKWDSIYLISKLAGREVSILIDAKGEVFVDWGGPGLVPLSPPVGAKIPFRLWVHTHPFGFAYWSGTDQRSLSQAPLILDNAWVMGKNGVLSSTCMPDAHTIAGARIGVAFKGIGFKEADTNRIDTAGPLSRWTAEKVCSWDNWQNKLKTSSPWLNRESVRPDTSGGESTSPPFELPEVIL